MGPEASEEETKMKNCLLLLLSLTMTLFLGSPTIEQGAAVTFAQGGKNANLSASIFFTPSSTGIHDGDGKGIYTDGVDGTKCLLYSGSGDLTFQQDASRTKTPRTGYVDYTNPVAPAVSLGIQYPTGTTTQYPSFMAHPYALLQMVIGSTKLGPVGLTTSFSGISYHIQFGYTAGDGSNQVLYTRLSATQWEVQTLPGQDVGRLVTGNPGTTQTYVGLYHVPLDFIITQL
jgi:hypothetical protein